MTYPASFAGLVRWLVVSSVTFSCFAKEKVTKNKATPICLRCAVPCVARLVRRLRNSRYALRQSSPTSPDQPPLLGGAQGMKSEKLKTVVWAQNRAHTTVPITQLLAISLYHLFAFEGGVPP